MPLLSDRLNWVSAANDPLLTSVKVVVQPPSAARWGMNPELEISPACWVNETVLPPTLREPVRELGP